MSVLKFLLLPLAWIYHAITALRNYLYNTCYFASFQFDQPMVISVGNLTVGGSGKTPMIEYLIRLLSPQYNVAVLSRGYGRKTSGFRLANESDDAETIGDEPFQLYQQYHSSVKIAVGEERALAIPTILNHCPDVRIILMDDAFQHRTVVPDFSILLTDYHRPFFEDYLLPVGRLRESRVGAKRANTVVVTKCPTNFNDQKILNVKEKLSAYFTGEVYFSSVRYSKPFSFGSETIQKNIVLVTGIAKSKPLEEFVAREYQLQKHFDFPDHHRYTLENIEHIQQTAKRYQASILTTSKDKAKLVSSHLKSSLRPEMWFEIPIESIFLNNGSEFDAMILQQVELKMMEIQKLVTQEK